MTEEEIKQLGTYIAIIENHVIHINDYLRSLQKQNEMALEVIDNIRNGSVPNKNDWNWVISLFHARVETLYKIADLFIETETHNRQKENQ